jgi:son of sevenless-like protein
VNLRPCIAGPTHSPVQGSKKKLAKWLGEDEVSDIISPGHVKVIAEEHPVYLGVDYSDDDIIINADGSIKAGTLVALIERLTLHDRTG